MKPITVRRLAKIISAFTLLIAAPSLAQTNAPAIAANPPARPAPIFASQVDWKEHFGTSTVDTNTLFCLMAHDYFRGETTNVQKTVSQWLKNHPDAIVVSVSWFSPIYSARPASRFAYVWIVQGHDNLNLELVRRGCFAAETQMLNPDQVSDISTINYQSFVQQVTKAGELAKKEKLGIFKSVQPHS